MSDCESRQLAPPVSFSGGVRHREACAVYASAFGRVGLPRTDRQAHRVARTTPILFFSDVLEMVL